ncbi:hypothetical protein [Alteribacillus bidgolensis]|nr:hypothetical protein [Alteribacillus bidgolensis]
MNQAGDQELKKNVSKQRRIKINKEQILKKNGIGLPPSPPE